jgi:hypothetical protein
MDIVNKLKEIYPESSFIYLVGLNDAIIGVQVGPNEDSDKLVYLASKIIANFVNSGMSYDEALEYYYFNVESAYFGDKTPVIVNDLELDISNQPASAKDIYITFRAN